SARNWRTALSVMEEYSEKRYCRSGENGAQDAPRGDYSDSFSQLSNGALGTAPFNMSMTSPFLKIMMVGMLRIPKRALSSRSASVLTFTKRTLPLRSSATSSKIGAKLRHGPHHGAQKSTTTGRSSFSSLSSVSPVALI